MAKNNDRTKVITGICTFSYLSCWEPKAINGGVPRYSVSLIIPKSDGKTVEQVRAAVQAAYDKGLSKLQGRGGNAPKLNEIWNPLRDGDRERPADEAYKDSWFINAKSDTAPLVVDSNRDEIFDRAEMYSGVMGRASVTFYAFNKGGTAGIAAGLNGLQKIADGMPLGGRARVADDFITGDDDGDFLN